MNEVMEVPPVAHGATAPAATTPAASTAAAKTTAAKTTFAERFAEAEKAMRKGEQLEKVKGHQYGRVEGGVRDGRYLNLSGNARNGEAFRLVERGGHAYHVYGTGSDRVVVRLPVEDAAKTDAAKSGTAKTDATKSGSAKTSHGGVSAVG